MRIVANGSSFTTLDLRRGLVSDLEALRKGTAANSDVRTRAYVAKQIIDTMKLELIAERMRLGDIAPIALLEAA